MGNKHDRYGKEVLRAAFGLGFTDKPPSVHVDYGTARPARIDGTIDSTIAVEIDSCVAKQVRGSVLDLICHDYKKKLLVLLPVQITPGETDCQCRTILRRFAGEENFRVVVFDGDGDSPRMDEDVAKVQQATAELLSPHDSEAEPRSVPSD